MRRSTVIAMLCVAVLALFAANAARYGWLRESFFVSHEKALDGGTKLFGSFLLAAGALASYFRFFRGRTFSARAEVDLAIKVMNGPPGCLLHAIDVQIRNVGTVPLWEPTAELRIYPLGEPPVAPECITRWRLPRERDGVDRTAVIDPQERGLFHATREFDRSVWAVRYEIVVTSAANDAWHSMTTVANSAKSNAEEA